MECICISMNDCVVSARSLSAHIHAEFWKQISYIYYYFYAYCIHHGPAQGTVHSECVWSCCLLHSMYIFFVLLSPTDRLCACGAHLHFERCLRCANSQHRSEWTKANVKCRYLLHARGISVENVFLVYNWTECSNLYFYFYCVSHSNSNSNSNSRKEKKKWKANESTKTKTKHKHSELVKMCVRARTLRGDGGAYCVRMWIEMLKALRSNWSLAHLIACDAYPTMA